MVMRWDDPALIGSGGQTYDPNTMRSWIDLARRGDLAANNLLHQVGYNTYNQEENLDQWAIRRGLQPFGGNTGLPDPSGTPENTWQRAWNSGPAGTFGSRQAPEVPAYPERGPLSTIQRSMVSDDPDMAFRETMRRIGRNPDAPGLIGNFIRRRFQPLLEARMAVEGIGGGNAIGNVDNVMDEFGRSLFQSRGGDMFQELRSQAEGALAAGAGTLNALQDQGQAIQYINSLMAMRHAGANQVVQQALADQMRNAANAYGDYSFDVEGRGQNIDPFLQWARAQERFRGLF